MMRWPLRPAGVIFGALVLLSAGLYASCFAVHKTRGYRNAIVEYRAASPLVHLPPMTPGAPGSWDSRLTLADSVTVSVRAADAFSSAFVRYSDEPVDRTVYRYVDYVHVADIRAHGDRLYVLAHGLAGGLSEGTRLVVFDLRRRLKLFDRRIDLRDVSSSSWSNGRDANYASLSGR